MASEPTRRIRAAIRSWRSANDGPSGKNLGGVRAQSLAKRLGFGLHDVRVGGDKLPARKRQASDRLHLHGVLNVVPRVMVAKKTRLDRRVDPSGTQLPPRGRRVSGHILGWKFGHDGNVADTVRRTCPIGTTARIAAIPGRSLGPVFVRRGTGP